MKCIKIQKCTEYNYLVFFLSPSSPPHPLLSVRSYFVALAALELTT